jgi:hypothetical protein
MRTLPGLTVLLAVSILGCAGRRQDLPPMMRGGRSEKVHLTVQNDRFEDARIYAVWNGGRERRLGTATGKSKQTFTFDWVSDVLRIRVDFVAAEDYTVDGITVAPGDDLDLQIGDGPD